VWEWCQNWSDGFDNYFMEEMDDPVTLTHHLRRGGCWSSSQENCNVLTYGCSLPSESNSRLGLRLVFGGEDNYPKVCFAKRRVPVLVGESSSVTIRHGWGKYSVKGGEGIVSCTVSGEQLVVTGISHGNTVIQLTNVYTGDVAELEVNVLGAEHFNVNGVEFTMQPVQGGEFTMGALNGEVIYPNQYGEPYEVELNPFYMAETEVTQALWQVVMGKNPSFFDGDPERPVEMVSWEDCQEFIDRLNQMTGRNFCLPTEAQWEFAARGGNSSHDYSYAGSSSIDPVAWYWDNIPSQMAGTQGYGTQAVATKSPNELGLYDMSGNVLEWTWDWYADYRWSPCEDPTGPYTGTTRSVRGGGWNTGQQNCGVVYRDSADPTVRTEAIGLRLAMRIPFYW
jgi:formylglycine-generating enzyme required for sulfatase activity